MKLYGKQLLKVFKKDTGVSAKVSKEIKELMDKQDVSLQKILDEWIENNLEIEISMNLKNKGD